MSIYKKVLLVDDNDTDNFISKKVIQIADFSEEIIVANSGKKALDYLQSNAEKIDNLPDVIFLDINMPIVDGFVFLVELKKMSAALQEKVRVVVLSSTNNKAEISRILSDENVDQFITKPLTVRNLNALELQKAG